MSLFSRLFKKEETFKGRPYFTLARRIIEDPGLAHHKDIKRIGTLMDELSSSDQSGLYGICDLIEAGIARHFDYLVGSKYAMAKIAQDKMFIYKSYFELICLFWVLITNSLTRQKVQDKIGHALWWTIKYSFEGREAAFSKSDYGQFESAWQARQGFYVELLNKYFKQEPIQARFDAFEAIIERPISNLGDEIERTMSVANSMVDTKKGANVLTFNKLLRENILTVEKELETTRF